MGIEIRDFNLKDQDTVRALILNGLLGHWGSLDRRFNSDLNDMQASYSHGRTIVASDGTRIVGTGTVIPLGSGSTELVRMSVADDLRRRGVGRQLVAELISTSRDWGRTRIVLETASHWTDVVAFYERCGFHITHEVDGQFCRDTWFEMNLQ